MDRFAVHPAHCRGRNETKGECRSSPKTNTRTANADIHKAVRQVVLARQSVLEGDIAAAEQIKQSVTYSDDFNFYVSAVVTTATLYVCHFDDESVDGTTGELPFDKAKLQAE